MRLAHSSDEIRALRVPTPSDPLRVLVSGCLAGMACGVDGTDYGLGAGMRELLSHKNLKVIPFCPEDNALGTPRTMPDIHGGDGNDVLDGRARVLDEHGADLTAPMILGARNMLAHAQANRVELAILTDMSAACGSQVISKGCRKVEQREYTAGVGVAAALLLRNGIPIVSQRDYRTLVRIRAQIDPDFAPDNSLIDHHESAWYRGYFGEGWRTPTPLRIATATTCLVEVTSERLFLRRFQLGDAPLLGELDADPEVMKYIDGGAGPPRPDLDRQAIERFVQQYEARPGFGFFAAHRGEDGEFIGWFHFRPDRNNESDIDLGYRLRRSAWGAGLATEGARALLRRGFSVQGVPRVVAHALLANRASWRVMEKLGMRRVQEFIEERFPGDDKRAVKYEITAGEFERADSLQREEHA